MANQSSFSPCHIMFMVHNTTANWKENNSSFEDHYAMDTQTDYSQFRNVSYGIILPSILAFGIIGNAINVAVFSKKKMWLHQDVMEKSARVGLISLAIADLLFCVVGFPSAFVENVASSGQQGTYLSILALYYTTYRGGLLNVFVFMSTWFIISLSMERYFAVVHPFQAKNFITIRRTVFIKMCVVVLSILINIPGFLKYSIVYDPCYVDKCACYYAQLNSLSGPNFDFIYSVIWHILGTFTPLVILMFCNVCLLVEIYKSTKSDQSHGIEARDPTKITFILISIVTLFLVLVCPSMILSFLAECVMDSARTVQNYQIAVIITNLTQALNFAINFLLYCALSPKFREEFRCNPVINEKNVKCSKLTTLNIEGAQV